MEDNVQFIDGFLLTAVLAAIDEGKYDGNLDQVASKVILLHQYFGG
jgi:hypothetical protein